MRVDYRHILREDTVGEAMSCEAAYLSALMSIRGVGPLGAVSVAERRFTTAEGLAETSYRDLQETLGQRLAAPIREQLDNGWRSLLSKGDSRSKTTCGWASALLPLRRATTHRCCDHICRSSRNSLCQRRYRCYHRHKFRGCYWHATPYGARREACCDDCTSPCGIGFCSD